MLVVDPPQHTRYRKQVARAFTARKVGRMSDRVESEAEHPLDDLAGADGSDLVEQYAAQLPAAVIAHPDQLHWLQQSPDGWANAVEEVLRFDSPVQLTLRAASRDVAVAGVPFAVGDGVLSMLGGANRDPAVFTDPHRFDVTRENAADHIGFSAGFHYCAGARLARLEATVALRLLYERFPDLAAAGRPQRRDTRVLRGYEHLPVTTGSRIAA